MLTIISKEAQNYEDPIEAAIKKVIQEDIDKQIAELSLANPTKANEIAQNRQQLMSPRIINAIYAILYTPGLSGDANEDEIYQDPEHYARIAYQKFQSMVNSPSRPTPEQRN